MVKIAVQQPQFLPWEGYWHKVKSADVFVFYGGVDYQDRNYANRVMVGGTWMTLPVKAHRGMSFMDVMIDPYDVRKLVPRLKHTYGGKKRLHPERIDGLLHLMSRWRAQSLFDFLVYSHWELHRFLATAPVVKMDTMVRSGTAKEKMQGCLQDVFGGAPVEMLSSEAMRGWYDDLVKKVWYQQKPPSQVDETWIARVVNEDVPDVMEGWSWI